MRLAQDDTLVEKAMKLGQVLSTYLAFMWIYQNGDRDDYWELVLENYKSLSDLLRFLGVSVTVPSPNDNRDTWRHFFNSLETTKLTDEIQKSLNLFYRADIGTAFLLSCISVMYVIQSKIRSDALLFAARNDIQQIASDLGINSSLVTRFLNQPGDDTARLEFFEGIKKGCKVRSGAMTILFLAADPTNAARLRLGEELREISEQLALAEHRERFNLALPQLSLRPKDIARAILNTQPQIVHFSGHGTSRGELCFEDEKGLAHFVQPEALATLFEQFTDQVKCVVLNACYSEVQARAIAKHIDYVIGMNQAVGDRATIAFAIGFYQALGAGRTIEEGFEFGRIQVMLQGIPEHLAPVLIKKEQTQS